MTGESGVFSDPFYSPGTDYIAIGNTFITEIVRNGRSGGSDRMKPALFHAIFRSFFASTMSLYRQQYGGMGDCRLMAAKSTWDYAYYWSVLAFLYFRGLMTDLAFLQECELDLQRALTLNTRMQTLFRARGRKQIQMSPASRFIDQQAIPILVELNHSLYNPTQEPVTALRANGARLSGLADRIEALLDADERGLPAQHCQLLGDLSLRLA